MVCGAVSGVKALYDTGKLFWKRIANLAACIAAAVILLTPAVYNEFYWTCYHQAYRAVKHTEVNLLNFREYYSTDLMEEIKADINYDGEYAAGYGLNTAVLEYSGISTLDGYLGFYPQSYKEEFTKLIWPAYERVPQWQTYYGEWGARAYLFAGSGESIYNPYRNQVLSDHHLYLDSEQFVKMGGKYLFPVMSWIMQKSWASHCGGFIRTKARRIQFTCTKFDKVFDT